MKVTSCDCFRLCEAAGNEFPTELFFHYKDGRKPIIKRQYVRECKIKCDDGRMKEDQYLYLYCPMCGKKLEYGEDEVEQ